jgi:beta-lactamase class D OXA-48
MRRMFLVVNLGNEDVSGGVDHFWLDGPLRITAVQQIEFLKKLYLNQLHGVRPTDAYTRVTLILASR